MCALCPTCLPLCSVRQGTYSSSRHCQFTDWASQTKHEHYETPIFLINPLATPAELCAFARRRIHGAKDLARLLTCVAIDSPTGQDLTSSTEVFDLLLSDSTEALQVLEWSLTL